MKTLRSLGIALTLLLPTAVLASPTLRASCCDIGACCPGCPLCAHAG